MSRKVIITISLVVFSFVAPMLPVPSAQGTSGPQRLRNLIWRDPGDVSRLNLTWAEGGQAAAPKPPFTFIAEDEGGTNPKIEVRDARGVVWGIKWGEEVNSEVFAARLVWAVGYFVEPSYFVPRGRIIGVAKLDRAKKYVQPDGSFYDARFEKKDKTILKLSDEESWSYEENPFVGTKELNGLKVMVMLLSNWDSKDRKHAGKGSNTKIFVVKSRAATEHRYVVSDWGGSMGKWGGYFRRGKWDCDGYTGQNDDLVKGAKRGRVEWGYSGQHTDEIRGNIPIEHVRWLLGYLGRLSDSQIRAALQASGASPGEVSCFSRAVRTRISAIRAVAQNAETQ
jgi:hypothetical protein